MLSIHTLVRAGGLSSYKIAVIITDVITKLTMGRGLSILGTTWLAKGVATFSGPIGLSVIGAWFSVDIAGPAYRVVIPAVSELPTHH